MAGTDIHYQSIDIAQKFIQLFEKFMACHLMLNGSNEFDEERVNKFSK